MNHCIRNSFVSYVFYELLQWESRAFLVYFMNDGCLLHERSAQSSRRCNSPGAQLAAERGMSRRVFDEVWGRYQHFRANLAKESEARMKLKKTNRLLRFKR
jgi:hypothetical protein